MKVKKSQKAKRELNRINRRGFSSLILNLYPQYLIEPCSNSTNKFIDNQM